MLIIKNKKDSPFQGTAKPSTWLCSWPSTWLFSLPITWLFRGHNLTFQKGSKKDFSIFFYLLFLTLFLPSCTLLSESKKPLSAQKTQKPLKAKKTKKKKITSESQIVQKLKKKVLSEPLTPKQVKQLKTILKKQKNPSLKDSVKMILGQHFLKKTAYKKALSYYSQVNKAPLRSQALLEIAKIYYQTKKTKKALHFLKLFLEKEPSSKELLVEGYLLKLTLILEDPSPNHIELLKTYCQLLSYEEKQPSIYREKQPSIYREKQPSIYREKAKNLIFKIKENVLLDIKSEDFIEPVKEFVFFRVGKILFYREKFKTAYFYLKKFLRFSTESTLEEKALKYLQAIESRKKVNRKHIGAILPLSGPSASIGKRSLNGLKMGLGFYRNKESPFQLIVLDSEGQPDRARKAVGTLITKHHVIAIVGGALSSTALALAEEAQNFGVPILLMSQKSHLTKAGPYVFQNGLTANLIVQKLTNYLMDDLFIKNFAILYPNDPYGIDYANAFWSAVQLKGGKITAVQFYKPGETDFNGPIKRLTGLYYLTDRIKEYKEKLESWYSKKSSLTKRRAPPPENILTPILDFEVLFIPDSLKALSLIAPHIAYNDIKDIKLAGPSLWNQKKFLKTHAKYIDNIVFPDPGLSTEQFKQTDFYKQFHNIFNKRPGLFEVLGYESALALNQVISSGADTRQELRKELSQLKSFHGATGELTISPKREFSRSMNILKMEKNILSIAKPTQL